MINNEVNTTEHTYELVSGLTEEQLPMLEAYMTKLDILMQTDPTVKPFTVLLNCAHQIKQIEDVQKVELSKRRSAYLMTSPLIDDSKLQYEVKNDVAYLIRDGKEIIGHGISGFKKMNRFAKLETLVDGKKYNSMSYGIMSGQTTPFASYSLYEHYCYDFNREELKDIFTKYYQPKRKSGEVVRLEIQGGKVNEKQETQK